MLVLPKGQTDINGTAVILQSNASQIRKLLILKDIHWPLRAVLQRYFGDSENSEPDVRFLPLKSTCGPHVHPSLSARSIRSL